MTARTLRWPGGWARVGPWRGHADVAQLVIGAMASPDPEALDDCLRQLRSAGFTSVVTGAINPADSLVFVDAGFTVRERLRLLAHDMSRLPAVASSTRRARASDRASVLALDNRAFADTWCLDDNGLTDAIDATPATRFRVVPAHMGEIMGYSIAGRSGQHGYLQRLAVDPDMTRRGWGHVLVGDAMRWLKRHGVTRTLVNTQLDNDSALRLYESCGFERLPVGLFVYGRSL